MTESFTPLLTTTDWNAEWMQLQKARRHRDSAVYWNERAKTFTSKDYPNPYVNSFLERAEVAPEESVFDMGCGTGALALPLGEAGHAVTAADFSEGMLSILHGELEARGIKSVHCEQMSWEDDWEEHGIAPKSHDVCTASRSIAVDDMRAALLKRDLQCPCRLQKIEDNICMCKEFRDQIADPEFEGYCHCRLYYKEK